MTQIDKKTFKIKPINRYRSKIKKTQIVISCSLRKKNYHILRLNNKDFGETKKWNTYTITRDGNIFEHYDPKYYSDFIGIKGADKQSISIVLENMGSLLKKSPDKYINWINEECDENLVIKKSWMGQHYWEMITDKQYEAIGVLCDQLCVDFNIPKKIIEFHHYNEDVENFDGVVFKSNYIEDGTDVNPMLDIERINGLLNLNNQ